MRTKLYLKRKEQGEDVSCEFVCQCQDTGCSHRATDVFTENHAPMWYTLNERGEKVFTK